MPMAWRMARRFVRFLVKAVMRFYGFREGVWVQGPRLLPLLSGTDWLPAHRKPAKASAAGRFEASESQAASRPRRARLNVLANVPKGRLRVRSHILQSTGPATRPVEPGRLIRERRLRVPAAGRDLWERSGRRAPTRRERAAAETRRGGLACRRACQPRSSPTPPGMSADRRATRPMEALRVSGARARPQDRAGMRPCKGRMRPLKAGTHGGRSPECPRRTARHNDTR